jgi:hypothetical protein
VPWGVSLPNRNEAIWYAKTHFNVSIEDDLLYHLVINTDRIPIPDAVELIACGARRCFQSGVDQRDQDEGRDSKHQTR